MEDSEIVRCVLADREVSSAKTELCDCKKSVMNKAAIFTKKQGDIN